MSFAEGFQLGANKKQAREELAFKKRALDMQLAQSGFDTSGNPMPNTTEDINRKNNQIMAQSINALNGKLAAQDSDNGLLDFTETGDASYLQNTLNRNPLLKETWSKRGVQGIANIDFENDHDLLARNGFDRAVYDTPAKQAVLKKNMYKVYDGAEWRLGALQDAVASTGLANRVGPDKLGKVTANHEELMGLMRSPKVSPFTAEGHKYEMEINRASEISGVPANLIASMMHQEAARDKKTGEMDPAGRGPVTKGGWRAGGLMQLGPAVIQQFGVTDVDDPEQNILAGAQYMAELLKKYKGNTKLALAAYNAGPGTVNKYKGIPPYSETQGYVKKIMSNYSRAESYYDDGGPDGQPSNEKQLYERASMVKGFAPPEEGDPASTYFSSDDDTSIPNANPSGEEMLGQLDKNERVRRRADQRIETVNDYFRNQNLAAGKVKGTLGKDQRTAKQKDLEAAQTATETMISEFGGEEAFFKTDFGDDKNFNKAFRHVVAINALQGNKFSVDDKKNLMSLRRLITLGGPASLLDDKSTGAFDSRFATAKKYFSDEVGGVEGKSAYAAFRNTMRHALFGSALTDGEIKSFNDFLGTTNQKTGPILEQFKVALSQVQSDLDSVSRNGNPYTNKVLLGADEDKLTAIQSALQERIDYLEGKSPSSVSGIDGGKPIVAPNSAPPLSSFFED